MAPRLNVEQVHGYWECKKRASLGQARNLVCSENDPDRVKTPSGLKAGVSLVRGARALQPDRKHGSSRKAMKLLVRLRRLAVAIKGSE
jgi:hypothetical protein